jgi:hypothetical protein
VENSSIRKVTSCSAWENSISGRGITLEKYLLQNDIPTENSIRGIVKTPENMNFTGKIQFEEGKSNGKSHALESKPSEKSMYSMYQRKTPFWERNINGKFQAVEWFCNGIFQ